MDRTDIQMLQQLRQAVSIERLQRSVQFQRHAMIPLGIQPIKQHRYVGRDWVVLQRLNQLRARLGGKGCIKDDCTRCKVDNLCEGRLLVCDNTSVYCEALCCQVLHKRQCIVLLCCKERHR